MKSRHVVRDEANVVHLVVDNGAYIACGPRISAEPWNHKGLGVGGEMLRTDEEPLTCIRCAAWMGRR